MMLHNFMISIPQKDEPGMLCKLYVSKRIFSGLPLHLKLVQLQDGNILHSCASFSFARVRPHSQWTLITKSSPKTFAKTFETN